MSATTVTAFPAAVHKFECFAVEPEERYLYAGDIGGAIAVVDIDPWQVVSRIQAHAGLVIAMAAHPRLPYVAAISLDRSVSLWRRDGSTLAPCSVLSVRNVVPHNDVNPIPWFHSTSQAVAFHPTERRLATRSGNGAVLELSFDDSGSLKVDWCTRFHGEFDAISVIYVDEGRRLLSLGGGGTLVLSEAGTSVAEWRVGNFTLHCAVVTEEPWCLLAGDDRFVTRFDLSGQEDPVAGPRIPKDDLEYVTYNRRSGRAFIASFDRRVYEIEPKTCEPLGVAWHAPFKCRWIRTLERDPSTLIAQVRNGGLYRVDLDTGEATGEIRNTPPVWWTAAQHPNGDLLLAGDGPHLGRIRVGEVDRDTRAAPLVLDRLALPIPAGTYTKRIDVSRHGILALGRTDGDVWLAGSDLRQLANVGDAVRDLAFDREGARLYVAVEDGTLHVLDVASGRDQVLYRSPEPDPLPIWALAYNPGRHVLAFGERYGRGWVISCDTHEPVADIGESGRCKRMKWVTADTLLFNRADQLQRFHLPTSESTLLVRHTGNTIEDFIWDPQHRYLVMVTYQCTIVLADFCTGEPVHVAADQMDYSKGIAWLPPDPAGARYPLDFVTFGRSGTAHAFRVHDEKVLALGPVPVHDP